MSLWSLLPAAISLGAQYLSRPKKSEYKPNTEYLQKYISSLRGRQSDREVYHMAMQPALRQIGAQGRRAQRQIGYDVAKHGLKGTGIEAQQRLSAGKNVLEAMQTASEQALARQVVESRQIGRDVDRAEMQVEAEQERSRQAYEQAQAQWRRGMISAGAEVAGAGISEYITGLKTAKATEQATNFAYQKAVASDDFTGSLEQFKQQAGGLTGEQYGEVLGIEIPTMERPLTADEIKRAGYYPAPEGFQYIYNENTGDVQLMGKTPAKPTVEKLSWAKKRRFFEIKNKLSELAAARDRKNTFVFFTELGLTQTATVNKTWNVDEYTRLQNMLLKEYPDIMGELIDEVSTFDFWD